MDSSGTLFDPYDYTGDALDLAYMFLASGTAMQSERA